MLPTTAFTRAKKIGRTAFSVLIALNLLTTPALAEPAENTSQTLTRTEASGLVLTTQLTKNLYKQEPYEEEYPVEVPYQAEEEYYESVPYQAEEEYYEQVPYQDTEEYTDYERQCSNQRVCHTEYERECRTERQCRSVPERQCRQERVCAPEPGRENCQIVKECGTNARGEEICKERKVCEREPDRENCGNVERCETSSRQECSDENVCNNVPRERCGYENVCEDVPVRKTRTVTKYRDERRTRTVTKYRDEKRTRTVTRHRTEYRCCVTKYRDVFDRQSSLKLELRFPKEAQLLAGEQEKLSVSFIGTEQAPDVSVDIVDSIFGYAVAKKTVQNGQAIVDLKLVPKYTVDQVGEKSVNQLKLEIAGVNGSLKFVDLGHRPRVASSYDIKVKSKENGAVIAQGVASNAGTHNMVIPLTGALAANQDYDLELTVSRSGVVLPSNVAFVKKGEHLFARLNADDFGKVTVRDLKLQDSASNLTISFKDMGADPQIDTVYVFELIGEQDKAIAFAKTVTDEELLKADKSASLVIPSAGLSEKQNYDVKIKVSRESKFLNRPVAFELTGKYYRQLDAAKFIDANLVTGVTMKGELDDAKVIFRDAAPKHESVKTTYTVSVSRTSNGSSPIGSAVLNQSQLRMSADGTVTLDLLDDLKADKRLVVRFIKSGERVFVNLTVKRESPRLNRGQAIVIQKSARVTVRR